MKNVKRMIFSGAVVSVCAVSAIAAAAGLRGNNSGESLPVSAKVSKKAPVIVLDAGHGEST